MKTTTYLADAAKFPTRTMAQHAAEKFDGEVREWIHPVTNQFVSFVVEVELHGPGHLHSGGQGYLKRPITACDFPTECSECGAEPGMIHWRLCKTGRTT